MSAPSSPTSSTSPVPPSPASPPPLVLLPAPPAVSDHPDDNLLLPNYVGNLENFFRSSATQKKWALVLILPRVTSSFLPRVTPSSLPTSPSFVPPTSVAPRSVWGPNARHQPTDLHASRQIVDNFMLWRRSFGSTDAQRYQAFFPTDGHPHVALLDPRSGERLAVWGNVDGQNMAAPTQLNPTFWSAVLADLDDFLKAHSLEDGALGPAHYQQKSWRVRTRRVVEQPPSTSSMLASTMNDEEAAIAAAIAASLADSNPVKPDEEQTSSTEDGSEPFYSSDSMTQDDDEFTGESSGGDDGVRKDSFETSNDGQMEEMDITGSGMAIQHARSQPINVLPQRQDPMPSSLESLSLSYIERMESRFRSSMDPALVEARLLREEQDAEYAKSVQEDRQRVQEEREAAVKRELQKEQQLSAKTRLSEEPPKGSANVVVIALRLPGGMRIARRFSSFDRLERVADFAISEIGCVGILDTTPREVLRLPGGNVEAEKWDVEIRDMNLGNRVMFVLHVE